MTKQESRQKIAAHLDKLISENLLNDEELKKLSVYDLRKNKLLKDVDLALIYEVLTEYQGLQA